MRIGAGLIQQHVAVGKALHDGGNRREETLSLVGPFPIGGGGIMFDPVEFEFPHDVRGAVAVMLVEIQDAHAPHAPLPLCAVPGRR